MKLKFITNIGSTVTLGIFFPATKEDLIKYVQRYEKHWVVLEGK